MDNILDKKSNVELTWTDCVIARMALRHFIDMMHEHVATALKENNYAAAVVHESTISDAIKVFGKLL